MTEAVLALIPDYGLIVIFAGIFLGTFGIPVPASMLALAGGGFAASGDLTLWAVVATAIAAYLIGDQLAFSLGRTAGPSILSRLAHFHAMERLIDKAKALLAKRGSLAVFLSHTFISPTCAYMTYLCGVGGLTRTAYSLAAVPGAALWCAAYVSLGYGFASQMDALSAMIGNLLGMIAALAVLYASFLWLRHRYRMMHTQEAI